MQILLLLALAALLLPVTAQYTAASLLLLWWLWRLVADRAPGVAGQAALSLELQSYLRPAQYAIVAHMLLTTSAALVAYFMNPSLGSANRAVFDTYHLVGKQGLLGLVLMHATAKAYASGFRLAQVMRFFAMFVAVYAVYLLLQRYLGIDWVRGLTQVLPENRYAYGVYRLSGFMGHPLSLAYNLVLLVVMLLLVSDLMAKDNQSRGLLWAVAGVMTLVLLISGSRWPSLIVVLFLTVRLRSVVFANWRYFLALVPFFAFLLYFDAAFIGRFKELFFSSQSLLERVPRLAFWQVHWRIFVDHPWAGAGFSASDSVRLDYYAANGYTDLEHKFSAHNIFLQTLADSGLIGIVGLVVWLGGCAYALKLAAQNSGVSRLRWFVPIVVLAGLLQNNLRDTEFLYAFWFCFALLICEAWASSRYSYSLSDHDRASRKPTQDCQRQSDQPYSGAHLPG